MKMLFPIVLASAGLALPALAHEGDFDIGVAHRDGRLVLGLNPEGDSFSEILARRNRVWLSDLGEVLPGDSADEPGFYTPAGAFSPGAALSFDILGELKLWTGSGFGATDGSFMRLTAPPLQQADTPAGNAVVPGLDFFAEPDGGFDWHPFFNLLGADEVNGSAPAGIYLLQLRLQIVDPNLALAPSEPFWIVFNKGQDEEDHEAAEEWVRENLVPAPGSAALGLLGVAMGLTRRRR